MDRLRQDLENHDDARLKPEMASWRLLVLAFVRDYLQRWGHSPSYGEIAAALESNRTRVRKAVRSLERDGLILRVPGPRGLSLPTVRDEAIRQLRSLGWTVDEDCAHAAGPVTNPPLLPPASLTYDPDQVSKIEWAGKHEQAGGDDDGEFQQEA